MDLLDIDAPDGADDGVRASGRGVWRTVLLGAVLASTVAAASFGLASISEPGAEVRARLILDRRPTAGVVDAGFVDAQVKLLASRDTLRRTAADVGLDESSALAVPAVAERLMTMIGIGGTLSSPEERLVDALAARFVAVAGGDGRSIDLRLSSVDSMAAVRFLRHLIDDYTALQRTGGVEVRIVGEPRPADAQASPPPLVWSAAAGLASLLAVFSWGALGWMQRRRDGRAERGDDTPRPVGTAPARETPFRPVVEAEAAVTHGAAEAPSGADLDLNGRKRIAIASFGEDIDSRRVIEQLACQGGQHGARVVVVDVSRRTGDRPGLGDLLSGEADFAAAIVRNPDIRAHEIGMGRRPLGHRPDEAAAALLLDTLEQTYDLVLIDLGTLRADPAFTLFARLSGQLMLTGDAEAGAVDTLLSALNRRGVGGIVRLPALAAVA